MESKNYDDDEEQRTRFEQFQAVEKAMKDLEGSVLQLLYDHGSCRTNDTDRKKEVRSRDCSRFFTKKRDGSSEREETCPSGRG